MSCASSSSKRKEKKKKRKSLYSQKIKEKENKNCSCPKCPITKLRPAVESREEKLSCDSPSLFFFFINLLHGA